MDKVDVLIPTRNPSRVNPRLLEVLASAPWVNNVVFETSRPLSVARKIGAIKCKTEWIAMFDDDVVIPPNWFEVVSKFARQPNVVAVSTVRVDDNIHVEAYKKVTNKIKPVHTRETLFICNTLIKREVFFDYNPPKVFHCEDDILYRHVKKKGKWVTLPSIGVIHHYVERDTIQTWYLATTLKLFPAHRILATILSRIILSIPAVGYSHTWRTIPFLWSQTVKQIVRILKALLRKNR